jgi:hypothetical protein
LVIDTIFFFVEITSGYAVGSLVSPTAAFFIYLYWNTQTDLLFLKMTLRLPRPCRH